MKARSTIPPPATFVVLGLVVTWLSVGEAAAMAVRDQPDPKAGRTRPNVLVIVTDDQRRGRDTMAVMPKTEQWFGRKGVTYPNGVVTTPLCCPARASIFSGKYVHNHGVTQLYNPYNLDQRHTIQHELKQAGYRTAIAGKFLNRWRICRDDPSYFDRFAIMNVGYHDTDFRVDHQTGDPRCGGRLERAEYSTTFIEERAVEYLEDFESADDEPWFLYVAPFAPHENRARQPPAPEKRYADAAVPSWEKSPAVDEADLSDKPPHVRDTGREAHATSGDASLQEFRVQQSRTLMSVDDMVGAIRETLDRLREDEDTLAVFLSDNGYLWAEHGLESKLEPYRWSVGVPFYARWSRCGSSGQAAPDCPGALPGGTRDLRLAANIDLAPTIYEAAGVEPGHVVDGRSLLDAEGREQILIEFWKHGSAGPQSFQHGAPSYGALLKPGDYLYRENDYDPDMGTSGCYDDDPATTCASYAEQPGHDELYDLRVDPFELVNQLHDSDPGTPSYDVGRLSETLAAARRCQGPACP